MNHYDNDLRANGLELRQKLMSPGFRPICIIMTSSGRTDPSHPSELDSRVLALTSRHDIYVLEGLARIVTLLPA